MFCGWPGKPRDPPEAEWFPPPPPVDDILPPVTMFEL